MGEIQLTQEAIGWYQLNMGISFNPWEVGVLRGLSASWLSESKNAERVACPPPYLAPDSASYKREKLPGFIKSFLRD